MITGKCKTDFKKWFYQNYLGVAYKILEHNILHTDIWENLPFSMQYGVYVDFFHTIEYEDRTLGIFIMNKVQVLVNVWNQTLDEARQEAIKQANKIYNEKHSD